MDAADDLFSFRVGTTPVVATAVHDGHELRTDVRNLMALDDAARLREEDPFTARLTQVTDTRVYPRRSRFEVDLNRPREAAVYRTPADAWGLRVWRTPISDRIVAESLRIYDAFYTRLESQLADLEARFGRFVVLDLHSYNYRRGGPDRPPEPEAENPEVNIGTGTMQRDRWADIVDGFIADLRAADFAGRHLDVRENVRFFGGNLARWTHTRFLDSGCVLAVEFKKIFMDEWSGTLDESALLGLRDALAATIPGLLSRLESS